MTSIVDIPKPSATPLDTKEALLDAAEQKFPSRHPWRRVGGINELAGQRNPSALHYHFGSRSTW